MTQNNYKIAVTGGIGSGKSTVCGIIESYGYPVISCDAVYNRLLREKTFSDSIAAEFGEVLDDRGLVDKSKLSSIVFNNKDKLKKLNEITHKAIIDEVMQEASGKGIYFCEVPLLFEGSFEKLFDGIIVVLRDKQSRVNAVSKRDNLSQSDVLLRISNQVDYDNMNFEKYYVIHNTADIQSLHEQTIKIIEKLIKIARF